MLVGAFACAHTPQLLARPGTEDREIVLRVHEAFGRVKRRLEALRDGELARLPDAERERMRPIADSIVAKLLHEPMRRLKSEEDPSRKLERVEAIRHLFDLDRRMDGE